jgi:FtsZ-binding cell division protein ZapB
MATVTRQQLMLQINALRSQHPEWGNKIRDLVDAFESDQMSFDELQELIEDYRRQVQNDASIKEAQTRTQTEVCLEMLFNLARAVI